MPQRSDIPFSGAVAVYILLLVSCFAMPLFTGGYAWSGETVENSGSEIEDPLDKAIEQALTALKNNPEAPDTLDELASLYIRKGDYREAGRTYIRRLKLAMDNPSEALPYAICIWHLRQEYEAQSAMLRGLASEELQPGHAKLLRTTLDYLYDPQNVVETLKPEFAKPEELEALENLRKYWLGVCEKTQDLERRGAKEELERYASEVFGGVQSARAYHAIWRCFALEHQKKHDEAEMELGVAAHDIANFRIQPDIATATAVMRQLRQDSLSSGVLNTLSDLLSEVSSTAREQFSDSSKVSAHDLFTRAKQANEARKFRDALEALDAARPRIANERQRLQYIGLLGTALWGVREYARANQDHVAVSVFQKERYALSDALFKMAEYAVMLNNRDEATDYAVRSAGVLRDSAWKLRQVGSFFIRQDMPERGIAYLERSLEASTTLMSDADSYSELATAYKRIGKRDRYLEYAAEYVKTIDQIEDNGNEVAKNQDGLRQYYKGEIQAAEKNFAEAYLSYERASEIITEPYRLAEILMIMAEYQATSRNNDKAEALAERSNSLIPRQPWKLRQVGHLLTRANKRDKALRYFEEALEYSFSFQDRIQSYAALTDAQLNRRNYDAALRYAREYISLVGLHRDKLTDAEEGLAAFYQGEIFTRTNQRDLAYPQYERAVELLDNRFKRAEIFMKMAEYQNSVKAPELAAQLAEKSAAEVPDQAWKLKQVADFLLRIGVPDKAMEYYADYARMIAPENRLAVYSVVADAYKSTRYREQYIQAAQAYIDAAAADGRVPTDAEKGMVAYYEGEIHGAKGEKDLAKAAYERASGLLDESEKERLAEVYLNLARYQADAGDKDEAVRLAEKAAEVLPESGNIQRVGDLLMRVGANERAFAYFERFAEQTSDRRGRIGVFATMADWYKRHEDMEKFRHYAGRYVEAAAAKGYSPTRTERGVAAYYEGEIAASRGETDAAYSAYEKAAGFVADRQKRAEIYMKMARMDAKRGDKAKAAEMAEKAAEALPDDAGTLKQVSDFLMAQGMTDKAVEYLERYLAKTTGASSRYQAYAAVAESQKSAGNRELYLKYAGDLARAFAADSGPHSPGDEALAAYYAAEVRASEGKNDEAYQLYGKAAELTGDNRRRIDVYMKMAEHQNRHGDKEIAAELAVKAAEVLPKDGNLQQRVGDFLLRLNKPKEAQRHFMRYAELSTSPGAQLLAYSKIADSCKKMRNMDEYRVFAGKYIELAERTEGASNAQRGAAQYYRGEIAVLDNDLDAARDAYGKAVELITEKYRRAEIFMILADIENRSGNRDKAADMAESSLALLPDQAWKIRQVVDMLVRINMTDRGIAIYEDRLAKAETRKEKADYHSRLAGIYRRTGDEDKYLRHAGEYVEITGEKGYDPTPEENGLSFFYRGERHFADGRLAEAAEAYAEAAGRLTDKNRRFDAYMKLAEVELERGDKERAAEMTALALALLPQADDKVQEASAMFLRLEMPGEAVKAFEDQLALADTPQKKAPIYLRLAGTYQKIGDTDKYAETLAKYLAVIEPELESLSNARKGDFYYYRGEYHRALKQNDRALPDYEKASELITEKYRLAEILMRMANIEADNDNPERAAELAQRSSDLLPDAAWKTRQVAEFFSRLKMQDRATALYERNLRAAQTPKDKLAAYADLANMHKSFGNKDEFAGNAREYIAIALSPAYDAKPDEKAQAFVYRAEIHMEKKELDEAFAAYESAVAFHTNKRRQATMLLIMAGIRTEQGDKEEAAALIEKAIGVISDDAGIIMDAGHAYIRLGQPHKAGLLFDRRVELAKTPIEKTRLLGTIAYAYKEQKERKWFIRYAERYIDALELGGFEPDKEILARRHYFQAEIYIDVENRKGAVRELSQAYALFSSNDRKFETLMLLGKMYAQLDDEKSAAACADAAAGIFFNQHWRLREVGQFFLDLGDRDKALHYFGRFLSMAKSDKEKATIYANFAETYKRMGKNDKYIEYARQYADAIERAGDKATEYEKGFRFYFLGEIYNAEKEPDLAYEAYESAATYIKEPYRLSVIYMHMARYHAGNRNREAAATLASAAASQTPGNFWQVRNASDVLSRVKHFDAAESILQTAIFLNPKGNVDLYDNLSQLYNKTNRRQDAIEASKVYIDSIYENLEAVTDPKECKDKTIKLWEARERHAGLTRLLPRMSWETTVYGRQFDHSDNYSYGMYSEFARYFWHNRRLNGKVYAVYEAALDAYYSGFYRDKNDVKRPWQTRQKWGDTDRIMLGLSINPFVHRLLRPLSFKAEQIIAVGRKAKDDFRFRAVYDRGSSTAPRPFGCYWPYWKVVSSTSYSVRNDEITSSGNIRGGATLVSPWDRNFIIIPYAIGTYSYAGPRSKKSTRWGFDGGLGIQLKKHFGETRYRTARESFTVNIYYRWGLTHNRKHGPGFSIGLKF